ncbi:MAG: ATP-dependent Clp protease ATP-binding subunit [bacterium]
MNNNLFKKFGDNLKKILILSEKTAIEQNTFVNTEHQLLAICLTKETLAAEILSAMGATEDKIQLIISLLSKGSPVGDEKISYDAKKAIQIAVQIASEYNHFSVEAEHLLLALMSDKSFNSHLIIERIGIKPIEVTKKIEGIFVNLAKKYNDSQTLKNNMEQIPSFDESLEEPDMLGPLPPLGPIIGGPQKANASVLDSFTTNLTKLAREGKLDPVIGREAETQRLIQTLSRRTKNNPILIGEPGVGKTSIVEGLAFRIAKGKVPNKLENAGIFSLDIGSLLAGTMYRGQFESRIKKLLLEIKQKKNAILFVDEIHMLVGAGSTEGSIDAANLLKPMLARGELKLIGSTTFDEYKKHIEKDPAFERRLQPIKVTEPSVDETYQILLGVRSKYEKFHKVRYSNDALMTAADLAKRYISDRFLPDKAIDLVDEAGAYFAINSQESSEIISLKNKLQTILKEKELFISKEDYEKANTLRQNELSVIKAIKALEKETAVEEKNTINPDQIAKIVADWTGIPATSLSTSEKRKYLQIESRLKKYIIGQTEAIAEISQALRRRRVGISNSNKPIGSFIFLGPTGVGKTELARVLAKEIFGDEKNLVKIDMSEFMERHNVSRLVGAPAGYVGYEEGGKLTETIRKNPYSVILFDEIEKAHPEAFNILLQIMDEGRLTDAKGRVVDFKNTIIIMTSNLGSDDLHKSAKIGFSKLDNKKEEYAQLKENALEAVEKGFRPEFLNRLDKVIVFYPLNILDIKKIVQLQINNLNLRLKNRDFQLVYSEEVIDFIAEKSYSPKFGARPIHKYISDKVEMPISDQILKDKYQPGDTITISLEKDTLKFK